MRATLHLFGRTQLGGWQLELSRKIRGPSGPREARRPSVDREAEELARTAGADQVFPAASLTEVGRIPRGVGATLAVGMADHRPVHRGVGRPVVAGHIEARRE